MRKLMMLVIVFAILVAVTGQFIYVRNRQQQQKRQKSTATRLYQIRAALNVYSEANSGLLPPPPANASVAALPPHVLRAGGRVTWLAPFIAKQFRRGMPETDGWGHPLYCSVTPNRRHFMIVSLGRDGRTDSAISDMWPDTDFDRDLIMVDGTFISAPRGWSH